METTATEAAISPPLAAPARTLLALLAIVLLVAAPVRFYLAATAAMISRDGVNYVWYAQGLDRDPLAEIRSQKQHPLYPAMLLGTHKLFKGIVAVVPATSKVAALSDSVLSWQTAGMAVTLVGGLAVVVAIFFLAGALFNPRIGLVAAGLAAAAAEFAQLSADALTDMPHLAVYLLAAVCCIHGLRGRGLAWLLGGGMLSGLAYLFRPEGAEVAVVAAALAAFARWPARRRIAGLATIAAGALLVASPYMLVTGKLIQKKSLLQLIGWPAAAEPSVAPAAYRPPDLRTASIAHLFASTSPEETRPYVGNHGSQPAQASAAGAAGDMAKAAGVLVEKYARSLRVTFIIPAILWLVLRRKARRVPPAAPLVASPAEPVALRVVAALAMLHGGIALALIVHFDYWKLFSMRHVLVLAALTLPFASAGSVAIVTAVPARRAAAILLAAALVGPTLPWMLEQRFANEAYLRRAGEWIRTQPGERRILTTRHPVAFYADGRHVWSPLDANVRAIVDEVHWQRPNYLVFDEIRLLRECPTFFEDLQASLNPHEKLELVHSEQSLPTRRGTTRALVYRYTPGR